MKVEKMPILELEDKNNPLVIVQKPNNTMTYYQRGAETEAVVMHFLIIDSENFQTINYISNVCLLLN